MKIKNVDKLVANLHEKAEYVTHKRNLKQALNHGLVLKNVRKHRDIKLVTTERRRNYLVSEPNNHTTKCFSEK